MSAARHAQRQSSGSREGSGLEAGDDLGHMLAEKLGVPVFGDAEDPDLAVLFGAAVMIWR